MSLSEFQTKIVSKSPSEAQSSTDTARPGQHINWRMVTGPVTTLVASLARLQWTARNARTFVTDVGEVLDMLLDPTVVVVQAARRSYRRWRLLQLAKQFPHLVPAVPDIHSSLISPTSSIPC